MHAAPDRRWWGGLGFIQRQTGGGCVVLGSYWSGVWCLLGV